MRRLTGADRLLLRPRDDLDLDRRHLREGQDRIALPGVAHDAGAIEADRLLQRPARGLDRAALDLVRNAVGVDRFAYVDGDDEPPHADVGVALDLGNDGAVRTAVLVAGKADAVPSALARPPRAPAGARGRGLEDGPRARVPQMAQAQRQRVLAALGRELVEEGFDREHVGEGAER